MNQSDQNPTLQNHPTSDISRRDLLRVLGALGVTSIAGLTLEACSKTSPECTKPNPSSSPLPLTSPPSLAQLRALIRSSPDHLQARAEEAVATKNPQCIAEFVRDHIAVIPPFVTHEDGPHSSRWGIEGTLRAGTGTLRDRAELMAAMLGAAGIPAKVRLIDTPSGLSAKELYRARPLEFSVGENNLKAMVEAIQKESDARAKGNEKLHNPNGVQQAETTQTTGFGRDADPTALVETAAKVITTAIDGKMDKLPEYKLPIPRQIPVVTIDGNANTVLVALGSTAIRTDFGDTARLDVLSGYPLPTIEFSVTAFLNPRPGGGRPRVVELVKASWPVKDVIGRQVQVLFPPPQGSDALLQAPLSSYPARIPFIRVQPRPSGELNVRQFDFEQQALKASTAPETNPTAAPNQATMPLVATGSLFTVDGEVLVDAVSTEPAKDPAIISLDEKQSEAESQRVAKIDAVVNAASFPDIEVMLSVTDAKGQAIDGLGMSAFQMFDGGQPCRPILLANRQVHRKPRVLMLYDGSGSVTESFGSPEKLNAFNLTLAQTLVDASASQPFDVQVVGLGGGTYEYKWEAPSVEGLTKNMGHFSWSTLWTSFTSGALDDGPAAIIVVSDFDATDADQAPAAKAHLARAKVPVIAITTPGKIVESVLSEFMAATAGKHYAATDPKLKSALVDLVVAATTKQKAHSYRFHYTADRKGSNPRKVQVTMTKRPQVRASMSYVVPPEKDRVIPASVTGLYLTISVGGVGERRHLGGIEFSPAGSISQDPFDPALIAEARNALNGLTTVTVEPASPTLGAVLEDVVTSVQSMEPLGTKKWTKDDVQAFKAAATKVYRYPTDLAQLLAPPPASYSDPNVVPQGLRILVSTEQPQDNTLVSRIDIPPRLNQFRILGGATSLMSSAVRSSLWLSVNEALIYSQSAFAELQGRSLQLMERYKGGIPEESEKRFSPEAAARLRRVADQYIDYIRLVPTDGGTVAMWVVDPTSGTVFAVDETGRGGGGDCSPASLILEGFLDILKFLGVLLFMAFAHCEWVVASAAQAYRCMGIGTAAVIHAAASVFVEYTHHYPDQGLRGAEFGAELGLIGLHSRAVGHLQQMINPVTGEFKPHSRSTGSTVLIVLMSITFVWLNVHYVIERIQHLHHCIGDPPRGRPGIPSERRAPRGAPGRF